MTDAARSTSRARPCLIAELLVRPHPGQHPTKKPIDGADLVSDHLMGNLEPDRSSHIPGNTPPSSEDASRPAKPVTWANTVQPICLVRVTPAPHKASAYILHTYPAAASTGSRRDRADRGRDPIAGCGCQRAELDAQLGQHLCPKSLGGDVGLLAPQAALAGAISTTSRAGLGPGRRRTRRPWRSRGKLCPHRPE